MMRHPVEFSTGAPFMPANNPLSLRGTVKCGYLNFAPVCDNSSASLGQACHPYRNFYQDDFEFLKKTEGGLKEQ
jgi:hypothetical protein